LWCAFLSQQLSIIFWGIVMDPRAERSRVALRNAMLTLIKQKPYDEIQIKDITDCANTGRVTFYRHYASKEELLLDFIAHIYALIRPLIQVHTASEVLDFNQEPPIQALFEFIEGDRLLFKRLVTCPIAPRLIEQARRFTVSQIRRTTPFIGDFAANHITSCIIGNIMWWLVNDVPHSAAYMARSTHWLAMSGVMVMRGELDRITMPSAAMRAGTPFATLSQTDA